MKEIVQALISFVENASAIILEAAQSHVLVCIVNTVVWMIPLALLLYPLIRLTRKTWHKGFEDDDYWAITAFLTVIAAVDIFVLIILITDVVKYVLNPDYYAIQFLIDMWPGG